MLERRHRRGPRRWPVIETFGPTIQGEGPDAGLPCQFVRFGGCDYRCSWCDSMYAVEPAEVRAHAEKLTVQQLLERLLPNPRLVVLSGGNPALLQLYQLVDHLHRRGYRVSVETQGSVWRHWLGSVDRLVVSPKPPSSGMATAEHAEQTRRFMRSAQVAWAAGTPVAVKIVVFDAADLAWARAFLQEWPFADAFLSAGTPQSAWPVADDVLQRQVQECYRWLCEQVAADPQLQRARVLPQLHVIAWGAARGV